MDNRYDWLVDNKALMRHFISEAQEGGRVELVDIFVSEDYVNHTPMEGQAHGRDGMKAVFESLHSAFPDIKVDVGLQVAGEDWVATYKVFRGTHRGVWRGIEPSNRVLEIPVIDIVRFRERLITDHWAVLNEGAVLRQLGMFG